MEYTPLYSESFEVASDDHEATTTTPPSGANVPGSQSRSQAVDTANVGTLSEGNFDPDSLQDPVEGSETVSTDYLLYVSLTNEEDEPTTDVDQYSQTASIAAAQESPHKSDGSNAHLQANTQPPVS